MNKEFIEIRWHGRGGQGAITAAKIVAGAAFVSGYPGVVMAPSFGTERRGFNPRGPETQIYSIEGSDLSLVATAEITSGVTGTDEAVRAP